MTPPTKPSAVLSEKEFAQALVEAIWVHWQDAKPEQRLRSDELTRHDERLRRQLAEAEARLEKIPDEIAGLVPRSRVHALECELAGVKQAREADAAVCQLRLSAAGRGREEAERERDTAVARAEKAEGLIRREGYRRCDAMACNCGSWHGGHLFDRMREIESTLVEAGANMNQCGNLVGRAVSALVAERDTAVRERDAYRKAKTENDERFMLERDEARRERDEAQAKWNDHCMVVVEADKVTTMLRAKLDRAASALDSPALIEALAAIEHERWSGWERYREKCAAEVRRGTDPESHEARWRRQRDTPYAGLSEREKESDRVEARKSLAVVLAVLAEHDKESTKGAVPAVARVSAGNAQPGLPPLVEQSPPGAEGNCTCGEITMDEITGTYYLVGTTHRRRAPCFVSEPDPTKTEALDEDEDDEAVDCARCNAWVATDDGCEPTKYCHHCAQDMLVTVTAERDELVTALRELVEPTGISTWGALQGARMRALALLARIDKEAGR